MNKKDFFRGKNCRFFPKSQKNQRFFCPPSFFFKENEHVGFPLKNQDLEDNKISGEKILEENFFALRKPVRAPKVFSANFMQENLLPNENSINSTLAPPSRENFPSGKFSSVPKGSTRQASLVASGPATVRAAATNFLQHVENPNTKAETLKPPIRDLTSLKNEHISLKETFKIFSPRGKDSVSVYNTSSSLEKLPKESNLIRSEDIISQEKSSPLTVTSLKKQTPSMKKTEYKLETFQRSNQDTCLSHKPSVSEGDWVQSGDLLTDCANSVGGDLSLGQNIFIAYMPWEGYNFEDAILISDRLVSEDIFTSVHIERYEIENIQKNGISQEERSTTKEINEKNKRKEKNLPLERNSKNKKEKVSVPQTTRYEEITRDIPDVTPAEVSHLDSFGIVKIGSFIQEGDILVGKITPINKKEFTPYQKLLYTILDKQIRPYRDSSLRAPKGIKAKVMDIKIFVKPKKILSEENNFSLIPSLKNYINTKRVSSLARSQKNIESLSPSKRKKIKNSKDKFPKKIYPRPKINKNLIKSKNSEGILVGKNQGFFPKGQNPPPKENFISSLKQKRNSSLSLKLQRNNIQSTLGLSTNKSFLKTNQMRYVLSQGLKPHYSLDSILGINTTSPAHEKKSDKEKLLRIFPFCESLGNFPQGRFFPPRLRAHTKLPLKNFTQFSQLFSSSKKIKKGPRLIRTLQNIVNGQFKSLKIMKKLKKLHLSNSREFFRYNKKTSDKFPPEIYPAQGGTQNLFSPKSIKDIETIHIYLAEKRKIQVGDKMSGRHGNKGIVSQILPMQDMPFLPDGTPIDMVLNPLGVPSRMNVGQIYECLLGLAGKYLGEHYRISSFDEIYGPEASRSFVFNKLYEARRKTGFEWLFNPQYPGKIRIYDGRTGDCYHQPVTVGQAYMLRLVHMVDDKIHMRSTGPYSLVTQQPLRGRSKQGGQRLGEMEVWALEGYGAAFTLLEMLTVKSDDLTGRMTLWSNLILNKDLTIGTPEAFKVLICELQALCLDIGLFRYNTPNSSTSPLREDLTKNPMDFSGKSDLMNTNAQSQLGIFQQNKSLTEMTSLMSFP